MRFKATLGLAAILILLGSYLYFIELRGKEKKALAKDAESRFFSFSEFDIMEMTITNPTNTVILQQVKDHPDTPWLMITPIETVADEGVASSFASQLASLKSIRKVEENPSDVTPFGLEPVAHSVLVTLQGGDSEILEIGGESVTGREIYVRVGNTVHLVEAGIKSYLSKEVKDWRRHELFRLFSSDVQSFELERSGQKIEIAKKAEEWFIKSSPSDSGGTPPASVTTLAVGTTTAGGGQKADSSNVFIYLGTLASLRGEGFIDEGKEKKIVALGAPFLKLKFSLDALHYEAAFYKGTEEPDVVYAATTPKAPLYKISLKRFEELDKPLSYFQQPLPPPNPYAVDKKE